MDSSPPPGGGSTAHLLAADVGATNTRLRVSALAGDNLTTVAETRAPSGDASEIKELIRQFVRRHLPGSGAELQAAVIGLPGKVSPDRRSCAISYLDPDRYVGFEDLFQELRLRQGMLLNDLECGVLGVALSGDEQLELLCGVPTPVARWRQRIVLGMPGSGLGLGLGLGAGASMASEGGHLLAALDPDDPAEARIGACIARREQPGGPTIPTYENLLRGRAIPRILSRLVAHRAGDEQAAALRARLDGLAPSDRPPAVEAWAFDPDDCAHAHARETFRIYGRFLGRLIQSLALAVLPDAVYLGGAVVAATRTLFAETFAETFHRSPIHGELLERLPVYVVTNVQLNLDGATHKAASLIRGDSAQGFCP